MSSTTAPTVLVSRVKGLSTRTYTLSAPMLYRAYFISMKYNARRCENIVENASESERWIAEMIRELVQSIPGVYQASAENSRTITVNLERGSRWDSVCNHIDFGSASIQQHVANVLADYLGKNMNDALSVRDFMKRPTIKRSVIQA